MKIITIRQILVAAALPILVATTAAAQNGNSRNCQSAGGMIMTNLGAVDANTTMGIATGDLKGAVGATILNTEQSGDSLVLHVQHHWVTESGDTLDVAPAIATTTQVAPGLYAVITYPVHLKGGTGRFAGAKGDFTVIGEADLVSGRLVFRYTGTVCFKD